MFSIFLITLLLVPAVMFANGQGEKSQPNATTSAQKVVHVSGAFRGVEAQRFNDILKPFEARTGIKVIYNGSAEFETQILVQVQAGTPPDVAALPQPGLMYNLAKRGALTPLPQSIIDRIDTNYSPTWKDLGSYNGTVYGVFHRINAKSFVWYNKKAWEAKGYKIPKTWDELKALCDQIVKDGGVPWSIGMESGDATGWVGTDWMEDIMLRTAGPKVYDEWINHQIPFNDPTVQNAAKIMMDMWGHPGYVLGGLSNTLTTNYGDAILPLFDNPPKAWMNRQGNFIIGFMPKSIQANVDQDVGVFPLPAIDPKWGIPIEGGGDQFVMFKDTPEVRQFLEYLTTWESGKGWAAKGGAIFPYKDQNFNDYSSKIEAAMAKAVVNAKVFAFDASDSMPPQVGNGTFWKGMVDMVSGKPIKDVLDQIEASWPK
jgi:alpha-glucoside transport system substrate-binding protein